MKMETTMKNKKVTARGGKWSVETYGENALAIQSTEQDYDGMNRSILIIEHYDGSRGHHYDGSREHNEANAELIVRAVNSHEQLIDALKVCYSSLQTYGTHPLIDKQVKAAIEAATK